ncbi:hypothetical protein [Oscillatoria salina]|uniref:hypothetical protein n=1 Tax=Oscillatoria salina TaxID=331517 RepID=UPI0013B85566|nr:hypothetical protein [Oscillatoria salina]MBZ8182646.1 hypothetical protein [Oscillatoria salina IIICB1]NET88364.1 hypothetical protein [Kamptonema sp. SIO1D9]
MTNLSQGSLISLSNISQPDVENLQRLYKFRKPTEVLTFLDRNSFLVSLLLEAYNYIRSRFPNAELFLEYVPDPEIDDPQLVVYIATSIVNRQQAIDNLEQIDEDWWLNVSDRTQGKIYLTLD